MSAAVALNKHNTQTRADLGPLLLPCSYFQAWCERMRDVKASQGQQQGQAFQDDLRRGLGATLASSQEACRMGPLAQDWCMAQASVLGWRSFPQQHGTDRELRRAQAQQPFVVWRVTLGQCCEVLQQGGRRVQVLTAVQVAMCLVLWVHKSYLGHIHQAQAAQQLTTRLVPKALGQPHTVLPGQVLVRVGHSGWLSGAC